MCPINSKSSDTVWAQAAHMLCGQFSISAKSQFHCSFFSLTSQRWIAGCNKFLILCNSSSNCHFPVSFQLLPNFNSKIYNGWTEEIFKILRLQLELLDNQLKCWAMPFSLHSACYFTLFFVMFSHTLGPCLMHSTEKNQEQQFWCLNHRKLVCLVPQLLKTWSISGCIQMNTIPTWGRALQKQLGTSKNKQQLLRWCSLWCHFDDAVLDLASSKFSNKQRLSQWSDFTAETAVFRIWWIWWILQGQ